MHFDRAASSRLTPRCGGKVARERRFLQRSERGVDLTHRLRGRTRDGEPWPFVRPNRSSAAYATARSALPAARCPSDPSELVARRARVPTREGLDSRVAAERRRAHMRPRLLRETVRHAPAVIAGSRPSHIVAEPVFGRPVFVGPAATHWPTAEVIPSRPRHAHTVPWPVGPGLLSSQSHIKK